MKCLLCNLADSHTWQSGSEDGDASADDLKPRMEAGGRDRIRKLLDEGTLLVSFT